MPISEQYLLFLAKILTLTLPIALIIRLWVRAKRTAKVGDATARAGSNLQVGDYSEMMLTNARSLARILTSKGLQHREMMQSMPSRRTCFVLTIVDEALAGRLSALKLEVSAILMSAQAEDLVMVRIKSRGGPLESFGSAAMQIGRLCDAKLRVVASIDEIATSGGYLIATMASEVIAAPFACVGSVGLISTQLNYSTLLEKFGVRHEVVTAGQDKLTINAFNASSDTVLQNQEAYLLGGLEIWRTLLKRRRARAKVEEISTGKSWFGMDALKLGLIDEIKSFDEFVMENFDRYHFLTVSTNSALASSKLKNKFIEIMKRFI